MKRKLVLLATTLSILLGQTVIVQASSVEENMFEETPVVAISESIINTATKESTQKSKGKPVILDMDFGSDVDDACALRLAGTMHLNNIIDLKAVTMSVLGEEDLNLKAANGLLESQGITNIPIGKSTIPIYDNSWYWGVLAEYSTTDYEIYDSVKLWRKIIVESNTKVDICTTGYLGNLSEFCKSGPDEISSLTGMELLNTRVNNVYITGGSWTHGLDNNFFAYEEAKEAMDWVISNIDKQLIFITNDVGGPILCGGEVTQQSPDDALSKALLAWGTSNGRAAWDPMVMYICAMGDYPDVLAEHRLAKMNVDIQFDRVEGYDTFTENPEGRHIRIYRTSDDMEFYREFLDKLCLQGQTVEKPVGETTLKQVEVIE